MCVARVCANQLTDYAKLGPPAAFNCSLSRCSLSFEHFSIFIYITRVASSPPRRPKKDLPRNRLNLLNLHIHLGSTLMKLCGCEGKQQKNYSIVFGVCVCVCVSVCVCVCACVATPDLGLLPLPPLVCALLFLQLLEPLTKFSFLLFFSAFCVACNFFAYFRVEGRLGGSSKLYQLHY